MYTKTKWLISICLALAMIVNMTVTVVAIEPRYSDTNSVSAGLGFSGTTAICDISIHGADGTTSISNINITLEDSNGNVVAKWLNLSSTGKKYTFYETVANLTKGETYKLIVNANINRNGKKEPVSESKSQTCPK